MSDDNSRIVDDPRPGQQPQTRTDAQAIQDADDQQHQGTKSGCSDDEQETDQEALVEKILDAIPEEEIERLLLGRVSVQQWRGLLPDPESFAGYPEYVQKQMVAWNDVQIIDESKRNDRITDAVISTRKWSQVLSFVINIVFVGVTFVSFLITNNPASFGFLAIPGVTIAINVWQDQKDKFED